METKTFDSLTTTLGSSVTRRVAVRGLLASALAAVVGVSALQDETEARRRRKGGKRGKRKNKGQPQQTLLQPGERCQTTSQCVSSYICAVPVNGSNSDLYCSGGPGAICGAPNGDGDDTYPYCANDHKCVLTSGQYRCQYVPDEL
jgi:hypothetical protein